MKKNFSKYFMIAAVAVTMGCVSSCKDYEDEMVAEFRGEDVVLQGSIDNLESDLQKGLADAKAERDALEKKLTDEINTVKELYATKAELEAAKTKLENDLDAAKDQHKADIDALNTKIAGVDTDLQNTKTKLEGTIGRLTQAETKINTLEGAVAKLQEKDAAIEKSIENLKKTLADEQASQDAKIKALEDVIPLINSDIAALQGRTDSLATVAGAHEKAIADVNNLINELEAEHAADCDSLSGVLDDVQKTMKTLASKADVKKLIDRLEEDLTAALESEIAGVEATMNDLFNEVKAAAEKNASDIVALENALNAHAAEAAAQMAGLNDKIDSLDTALDEAIAALDEKLDGAIADLTEKMEEADSLLQDQIDTLATNLNSLEKRVAANEEAIAELAERMDKVEEDLEDLTDAFEKRITNISLQGAYSPVLGYFNMPMGMKSNVLAAYQGAELTNTPELKFPYAFSESVVAGYQSIDDAVLDKLAPEALTIEGGEIIGTQNENGKTYAGKVYMVVNPTEVNLTDVTFSVVNSLGEEAAVVLDQPVATEDKLSFGYTRAGAALYEATAYVDAEKTNVSLNVADYKDIFSDLKNRQLNVADIVSTLYNTFNNITDANAVSASWTDTIHGEEHAHTVMSDYALAAVSVKPLSFNMIPVLEDINFGTGTALAANKVNAIIDRLTEKVKFDIQIPGIEKFDIQIENVDIDESKFNISFSQTINVAGKEYPIFTDGQEIASVTIGSNTYPVTVKGDKKVTVEGQSFTVSYSNTDIASEIAQIESTINGSMAQLEAMVDQVNGMIEMLKETEAKLNNTLNNAKNTIASKLMSGVEKVANRMGALMNKADNILRPVMLLNTTDGLSVLSQSVNRPVAVANGAVLVPTTYNAELITPIYKKYVAVTKAWDKAGNEIDITSANNGEGFNKVLEGDVHTVALNGQSGCKYEITYSALDFHGYVVNTKYYVTVK